MKLLRGLAQDYAFQWTKVSAKQDVKQADLRSKSVTKLVFAQKSVKLLLKILKQKNLIFCFIDYCPEYKIHALEDDAKSKHHLKMQATVSMTKAKVHILFDRE